MSSNAWKTAFIILSVFQITKAWTLWACKDSIDNCLKLPYENADQICSSEFYNPERNTSVCVHPYRSSFEKERQKKLVNTLLQTDRNVLCVDWSCEANSILIGFDYVVLAKKVTNELTIALSKMSCLKPEKTQLIGMSLSAHMIGDCGRDYKKLTGNAFAEAIGLDPAKVLYQPQTPIFIGIDKTTATFTTIIHADTYKYGINDSRAHIDFWCNADTFNIEHRQPGCTVPLPPPFYTFTEADLCCHVQPLLYLIDSYQYGCNMLGIKADNVPSWVNGLGDPNYITCIGDLINRQFTGNFYMRTNPAGASPYGLGMPGIVAATAP